ncbi:aldo/keto reductase [Hymenobacter sp. RP-2-7]|uniref:Aldo/keto reductase n=1 Tax=Hymenobacter polaris TaxID=2682546 RepID=A0A7Y0AA84_9BACT|nr:aldo/keto reductase [Hymenobacter polaris]NML63640.1 aldo/keto reductase [Hymenobacter polaris]
MVGIGCSTFGGSNSKTVANLALNYAYEQGIIYFDVARSYGYGTAESIIGKFAADKRGKIFIASKFGILPPPSFPFKSTLLAGIRSIRMLPTIQQSLKKASAKSLTKHVFSPQLAEKSLNKSLKELKTNYIDVFLLHESNLDDVLRDDIKYVLEKAKEKGKIRSWGGTFYGRQDAQIAIEKRSLDVVQLSFGLDNKYSLLTNQKDNRIQIIYSILNYAKNTNSAQSSNILAHIINIFPQLKALKNIKELLLFVAFHSLPRGVILLSMSKPEHIDRNKLICQTSILTNDELSRVIYILRQYFTQF